VTALLAAALAVGCGQDGEADGVTFVQLPDSRLIKVQSVGLAAFGRINPHTATASLAAQAFGEPAASVRRPATCRKTWPGLGLAIWFAAGDARDPCADDAQVRRLVVAGRAAARAGWRTAEGIRPLQPVAAVQRIYPETEPIGPGRHVLVRPSAHEDPVLVVRIAGGRVEALEFPIEPVAG